MWWQLDLVVHIVARFMGSIAFVSETEMVVLPMADVAE